MYDDFSQDYDRFVNWEERLAFELPFIQSWLSRLPARSTPMSVLDAACGTGMHAIALARLGYSTAGADLSSAMIERARINASAAGVAVRFDAAGFGRLSSTFGFASFDALLCLGNSLPHTLTPSELEAALVDFHACLRPGGIVLIQNRNFDQVMAERRRWMDPQSHVEDGAERLFVRFYDFDPAGLITFNILTLLRKEHGSWTQQVNATRLRPLIQSELLQALASAGFIDFHSYGSMNDVAFSPTESGNLVVVAHKA